MFLIADAALVLLFLAGMAARYVHPRYAWPLQVVALGLPLLALGVVVASSAALLTGRWYLLAAHVPLLVLALIRFFPASWLNSPPGSDEPLTVVSANVKDKFPESGSVLASLRTHHPPDVIAVQETHIVRGAGGIGAEGHVFPLLLGYRACQSENGDATRRDRIENPIFSNLTCVRMREIESVAERNGRRPIMATRGEFTWRGRQFALYNIHLRSFSVPQEARSDLLGWFSEDGRLALLRRDFMVRAREAEALRSMLESETLPFILCGDFNATPHQWSYGKLADGLTDAFAVAGRGWRPTYHSRYPLISIDHFVVSNDWKVLSARTGGPSVSDHLPLIVQLDWRSSAGT